MKKANPQARQPVGRFVLHVLRFSLPFALLLALYVAADVFKVIYRYDAFYPPRHTSGVSLNAGYVPAPLRHATYYGLLFLLLWQAGESTQFIYFQF